MTNKGIIILIHIKCPRMTEGKNKIRDETHLVLLMIVLAPSLFFGLTSWVELRYSLLE
jgi:hypothetical protein